MAKSKKPTEQKVLQGTFRPDRDMPLSELSMSPCLDELPAPPVSCTAQAIQAWKVDGGKLIAGKILRDSDLRTLEMYCLAVKSVYDMNEAVAEHGPLVAGSTGSLVINPAVTARNQALSQYRHFAAMLGLDPSSRSKIPSLGGKQENGGLGSLRKKTSV